MFLQMYLWIVFNKIQIKELEKFKEEDETQKKVIEAKSGLENYVYGIKRTLNDDNLKDKFEESDRKTLQTAVDDENAWLNNNLNATVEEYDERKVFSTKSAATAIKNTTVTRGDYTYAPKHFANATVVTE